MICDIGPRVKERRLAMGLTLQALADQVGCSKANIWEIENKISKRPSAQKVLNLAAALDTTMDDLLGVMHSGRISAQDMAFFHRYLASGDRAKLQLRQILKILEA